VSSPHRVTFVKQLDGSKYAGLNCTCAAAAMCVDRSSIGKRRTTGAEVRRLTGDTSGGTRLTQVDAALNKMGVNLDVRTPMSLPAYFQAIHDGRGTILQGASRATRGTKWQASETFGGNHAWYIGEGRGWRLLSGYQTPTDLLVHDPLADGRRAGIARSPFWVPRYIVERFARLLDLDGNGNLLGPGRAYAALTRDTEPHVHLAFNGRPTSPFPDRTRAVAPAGKRVNVHYRPDTKASTVIETLADDELFIAYQVTDQGESFRGSRRWYGDHQGSRWIHAARLSHEGGST
jgi:hypothetical protein